MSDLRFTLGDQDVTQRMTQSEFGNEDPGGFTSLTMSVQATVDVKAGDRVYVWYGLECVWDGEVNDPGDGSQGAATTRQIVAVGHGKALKEYLYREIYVDRDLNRWNLGPNAERDQEFQNGNHVLDGQWRVGFDDSSSPVPTSHTGPMISWSLSRLEVPASVYCWNEAWYDSGQIPLGRIYYDYNSFDQGAGGVGLLGAAASGWQAFVRLSNRTNTLSSTAFYDDSGDLADGTGRKTGTLLATLNDRIYGVIGTRFLNGGATTSSPGHWRTLWRNIAVYGNHGLTGVGDAPVGFYPHDIVLDALDRALSNIEPGRVDWSKSYIVRHLAYLNPTSAEQVMLDMAKLMGWHVGVWEPSMFSNNPRLHFHPVPQAATCGVNWDEVSEPDTPRLRADLLYNKCRVTFQEPAGGTRYVAVTKPTPFLSKERVLDVNMGVGTQAAAEAYGMFALGLAQVAARGGGSCVLPLNVDTAQGPKPSVLLKAGRDRLRIRGLPNLPNLLESDTRRLDTFHIRKVSHTVEAQGVPRTRVEFDSGGDLLETLNARSEEALIVGGAGA